MLISRKILGEKAKKKFNINYDGDAFLPDGSCSDCGENRYEITQRPANPPIDSNGCNYGDFYELKCKFCKNSVGVREIDKEKIDE